MARRSANQAVPLLLVGLTLALTGSTPTAQTEDDELRVEPIEIGFTERTGRSLLFLDVEAVDGQGRPMAGLTKSEFKIRVNYIWRKIYSVDDLCPCSESEGLVVEAQTDPAAAARLELARTPPHFVLYFDYSQLAAPGRAQAVQEAKRWARDVMQPEDRVMVVAYSTDGGLRTLSELTGDRDAVLDAIEAGAADPDMVDPFPAEFAERQALCDTGTVSCYNVGRREYFHARRSLDVLKNFLTELDEIAPRKTMLLFHENATIFPGRQYGDGVYYWPESIWDRLDTFRGADEFELRSMRNRANSALVPDLLELSQEVAGSATASRTMVYPLACGAATTWPVNMGANLADKTGGDYNRIPAEVGPLLAEAGRKCACLYRIGLEMEDKKRSFVLRTKVRAAGRTLPSRYHVQYLTDADRWMRKAQLVLANPDSWSELEIGAAVVPERRRGRSWKVRVQVAIDMDELQIALTDDDAQAAEWEIAVLLSDAEGYKHWDLLGIYRASPGSSGRLDSRILHELVLDDVKPGRYELRAFVHDRSADRFGATLSEIVLPPAGNAALVGPIVQRGEQSHLESPLPLRTKKIRPSATRTQTVHGPLPWGDRAAVPQGDPLGFKLLVCAEGDVRIHSTVRREGSDRPYEGKSETIAVRADGSCATAELAVDTWGLEAGTYAFRVDWDEGDGAQALFDVVAAARN